MCVCVCVGVCVCVCVCVLIAKGAKHIWMGIRVNEVINHAPSRGVPDAAATEHEGQRRNRDANTTHLRLPSLPHPHTHTLTKWRTVYCLQLKFATSISKQTPSKRNTINKLNVNRPHIQLKPSRIPHYKHKSYKT